MTKARSCLLHLAVLAVLLAFPLASQAYTGPYIAFRINLMLPMYGDTLTEDMDLSMAGRPGLGADVGWQIFDWFAVGAYGGLTYSAQPLFGGTEGTGSQTYYGAYARFSIPSKSGIYPYVEGGYGVYQFSLSGYDWGDLKADPATGWMAAVGFETVSGFGFEVSYHNVYYEKIEYEWDTVPPVLPITEDSSRGDFLLISLRISTGPLFGEGGMLGPQRKPPEPPKPPGPPEPGNTITPPRPPIVGETVTPPRPPVVGETVTPPQPPDQPPNPPTGFPRISCPSTMNFRARVGEAAPGQGLAVSNLGGGSLGFSVETNRSWITSNPASGTAPASVTIVASCVDLTAGIYTGTITVNSPSADNSPAEVEVTLTCEAGTAPPPPHSGKPRISCPLTMAFSAEVGQAAPDQMLPVSNGGSGVLRYTLTPSSGQNWLGVSPGSGEATTETDNISVSATCANLAEGSYSGSVQVSAPGADNSPVTVSVTLTCQKFEETEFDSEMLFDYNSDVLRPEGKQALMGIVQRLRANPQLRARIEGHTCDIGSDLYNLDLSQRRAFAVVNFLIQNGIGAERLTSIGYGETTPKVPNTSEANRARNRRVVVRI